MSSWERLLDKVVYWLQLRAKRKGGGGDAPVPAPAEAGEGMPESVAWEKVCSFEREAYKVSAVMPLADGALVCSYNNRERGTSRLFRCGADGSRTEVWKGGEETVGQGYWAGSGWLLPVEKKNGDILSVPDSGEKARAYTKQGGQYACRIVEGHIGVGNQLFQVSNTSAPVATFPRLAGILCGLVHVVDEWIASDDERGIQSSKGWFIAANCPDLAVVGGKVLAFLRSGEVRVIEGEKLGRTLGNTLRKCRRAWSDGKRCWWTTAPSDGGNSHDVWVTDGTSMLHVGSVEGKAEKTKAGELGSLFGSAICEASDGTVWLAVSNRTEDGWELWKGTATYPAPKPEPTPEPEPTPTPASEDFIPPTRTGKNLWTGNGVWNTFKDAGRAGETSSKRVLVEGWFRATNWSGGGKEQAKGFCFASKGLVGSHWGLFLSVRPGGLVWGATKGEIVAKATVTLNSWHHVRALVEGSSLKMWLDGKLLANGPKEFSGALIANSGEPLRIGGYYTNYEKATWFNQSLVGQISGWKVEMK